MYLPPIGAEPLAIVLAGVGILLAAAQDVKTREVPDSLSSGLAVLGFALAALQVVFGAPAGVVFNSVFGFAFGYGVGALLYFAKQWGGGDAKLLAGVGALIGFFSDPSVLVFGVSSGSLLLAAGVLVVSGALVYLSRHEGGGSMITTGTFGVLIALTSAFVQIGAFRSVELLMPAYLLIIFLSGAFWAAGVLMWLAWRHRASLELTATDRARVLLGPLLAVVVLALGFVLEPAVFPLLVVLSILLAAAPLLLVVSKRLENVLFVRTVTPDELVMGDWLAEDLVDANGKVLIDKSNPGLSKQQIEWVEALWNDGRIGRIAIKDGIAFVPAFVIAFAVLMW